MRKVKRREGGTEFGDVGQERRSKQKGDQMRLRLKERGERKMEEREIITIRKSNMYITNLSI